MAASPPSCRAMPYAELSLGHTLGPAILPGLKGAVTPALDNLYHAYRTEQS
jgi:hypothetical protein